MMNLHNSNLHGLHTKYHNVTGMQGNRLMLRAVFDRYFPSDYVVHLFDGRHWSESQIVMAVYELEKIKRHAKKLRLPEAVSFLKSFLEVR